MLNVYVYDIVSSLVILACGCRLSLFRRNGGITGLRVLALVKFFFRASQQRWSLFLPTLFITHFVSFRYLHTRSLPPRANARTMGRIVAHLFRKGQRIETLSLDASEHFPFGLFWQLQLLMTGVFKGPVHKLQGPGIVKNFPLVIDWAALSRTTSQMSRKMADI
jgi:hypothetical protein